MSHQKQFIIISIVVTNIVFVLACQSIGGNISPVTPTAEKTPELLSNTMIYEGDWKGTTSQNFEIAFTVVHNEIVAIDYRLTWNGSGCFTGTISTARNLIEPTALATGNFTPKHPIKDGTVTIIDYAGGVNDSSYTFMSTFSTPNMASGTLEYVASGTDCDGTQKVNWAAEKIEQ